MKKIILFIIPVILIALFTGCEQFLEENNKSNYTSNLVYSTLDGIESLVNTCYAPLRRWYGTEQGYGMSELGTDITIRATGCTTPNLASYHNTNLSGTEASSRNFWQFFYQALNYCNTALETVPESSLSNTLKDRRIGEVLFLRAFYLWHIVETWGNVHLPLESIKSAIMTAERTPIETFYTQILDDLDEAIRLLGSYTDNYGGRINIWAAKAFKSRILLTRASAQYINSDNRAADYAEAARLAKEVIAAPNNKFELASDYVALWDMANSDGDTNKEVVWFVNYTRNLTLNGNGHQGHLFWVMVYDGQTGMMRDVKNGRPWNRFMPSLHYLQLFDASIDQRYEGSFKMAWYANNPTTVGTGSYPLMELGDTAIFITQGLATPAQKSWANGRYRIMDSYEFYENGHDRTVQTTQTPQLRKFDDPTRAAMNDTQGSRDHFVIRIAELYLIVAEAQLIANPTEALEYMNILRRARAITGKESEMEITASDLNIDFILEERARELGGEQLRWFDLKRTGKLIEYVRLWSPDAKANIKDYHTVRPIPQSQLDAMTNKDEFGQNPGYN